MLFCTVGININAHFCGDEYVGSVVNGVEQLTERGIMMEDCMGQQMSCGHCKSIHHDYRIAPQLLKGQGVDTQPLLLTPDWFHGDLQTLLLSLISAEEGGSDAEYHYRPPYCPAFSVRACALRAPPVSLSA